MFTWENSDGQKRENMDQLEKESGYFHHSFLIPSDGTVPSVVGVCQSHHHITRVNLPVSLGGEDLASSDEALIENQSLPPDQERTWSPFGCKRISTDRIFWDQVLEDSSIYLILSRDRLRLQQLQISLQILALVRDFQLINCIQI